MARAHLPTCHSRPPIAMHLDRDTSANFLPTTSPPSLTHPSGVAPISASASRTSTTSNLEQPKPLSTTDTITRHVCLGLDLGRWCHCFLRMAPPSLHRQLRPTWLWSCRNSSECQGEHVLTDANRAAQHSWHYEDQVVVLEH